MLIERKLHVDSEICGVPQFLVRDLPLSAHEVLTDNVWYHERFPQLVAVSEIIGGMYSVDSVDVFPSRDSFQCRLISKKSKGKVSVSATEHVESGCRVLLKKMMQQWIVMNSHYSIY